MKLLFTLSLLLLVSVFAFPQDEWKITGNIQIRSELDGRDFSHSTYPLTFTSLRTRLGVEKNVGKNLNFFAQLQDSRIFGETGATIVNNKNVDLYQGYLKIMEPFNLPVTLQAGRFAVAYGTERLLGAVGWHYISRSWDGVRFSLDPIKLDLFGLTQRDNTPYIANATPGIYPFPSNPDNSRSLYGAYKRFDINKENQLDLLGYYDIDRTKVQPDKSRLSRYTLNASYFSSFNKFSLIAEAAYQGGEYNTVAGTGNISAYLLSVQGHYTEKLFKVGAGIDMLSGTDPTSSSSDYKTFDPSYGTNHKFYGFMDYFINIPLNTDDLGLNDFYLNADFKLTNLFDLNIAFHYFMSNVPYKSLFITNETSAYGQELDITLRYNFIQGTSITWGGSIFLPGDLMKIKFNTAGLREDPAFWTYLMLSSNL
jgi:hypothetical protein